MDLGEHAHVNRHVNRCLSARAYRTMVTRAPDVCMTLQLGSGTILDCNDAVRTTLGYAPAEVVGRSILAFALQDGSDTNRDSWELLATHADLPASNMQVKRKDGGAVDVCLSARGVRDDTGRIAFGLAVLRTRGADRRAGAEAQAHDMARLKGLLYAISVAEERERRRIAAGLHDELGQLLAIAKLKLGRLGTTDDAADRAQLASDLGALIDQASRAARASTFELSSPVLQQFGLDAAIESLGERMQRMAGLAFRFESDRVTCTLPDDVPVVLLRVVRELLFNAQKHAEARNVSVSVRRTDTACTIQVEDDGVGFDAIGVSTFTPAGGYGLFSAQAQIESVGGSFAIGRRPGGGTRATVVVPLPAPS
jgi:PAS domain S-box-containing protein